MDSALIKKLLEFEDLKRLIFSFGEVEHRSRMRKMFPDQVNPDDDVALSGWWNRKGYTLMDSLIWFYKFRRCQCCSRHSHRKPDIVLGHILCRGVFFKTEYGPRIPEDKDMGDCQCKCRHEARYLCHMIQERTNGY